MAGAAAAAGLALSGCGDTRDRSNAVGSSTLAPPTEEIARLFNQDRTDVRIDVSSGGTGYGLKLLDEGHAAVAMIAKDLRPEETQGLTVHQVASDLIVHIAHPKAPLDDDISLEMLRGLYSGAIRVPGLTVFQKSAGHGTRQAHAEALRLRSDALRADAEAGSNGNMISVVERTSGGLGYVSHVDAVAAQEAGIQLRILSIDGVKPDLRALSSGRYPIIRRLAYVTRSFGVEGRETLGGSGLNPLRRTLASNAFVDFACGPVGKEVFAGYGFGPAKDK